MTFKTLSLYVSISRTYLRRKLSIEFTDKFYTKSYKSCCGHFNKNILVIKYKVGQEYVNTPLTCHSSNLDLLLNKEERVIEEPTRDQDYIIVTLRQLLL